MLCDLDEDEMQMYPYENRVLLSKDDDLFNNKPYREFIKALLEKFPEELRVFNPGILPYEEAPREGRGRTKRKLFS